MILTINLLSKIPRAPSQIGRNGWFTHSLNIQCAKNLKHLDGNSSYKRIDSVNEPCDTSDRSSFLKVVVARAAEEEEVWNKKSHQEDAMGGRSATNNFNSHQQLLPKTAPTHTSFIRQLTTETEKSIFLLRAECLWLMSMLDAESHK